MNYKVIISAKAKQQLKDFVKYIVTNFHSKQTAKAVLEDARETRKRLASAGGSLKYCDDPELQKMGYRTIHFNRHRYFYVYEIVDQHTILISAVYHELQDYENLFKSDMNI